MSVNILLAQSNLFEFEFLPSFMNSVAWLQCCLNIYPVRQCALY